MSVSSPFTEYDTSFFKLSTRQQNNFDTDVNGFLWRPEVLIFFSELKMTLILQ